MLRICKTKTMSSRKSQKDDIKSNYFPVLEKLFGFKDNIKLVQYDFQKPWFSIYYPYIWSMVMTNLTESLVWIFFSYSPILLSQIVTSRSMEGVSMFIGLFTVIFLAGYINIYFYCRAVGGIKYSLMSRAYKHFLLVDPINHATRSSGQIISKIDRGVASSEVLSDIFLFEIIPVIMQLGVTIFAMTSLDKGLGLTAGLSLIGMVALSIVFQLFIVKVVTASLIAQEDKQKQLNIESLTQVAHIRSSFATPEQLNRLSMSAKKTAETEATNWFSFISSQTIPRILYIVSLWFILTSIIDLVSAAKVDLVTGSALLLMYFGTYGYIVSAGRKVEKLLSNIDKLKDLYDFIRDFGDRTYPVLPIDMQKNPAKN